MNRYQMNAEVNAAAALVANAEARESALQAEYDYYMANRNPWANALEEHEASQPDFGYAGYAPEDMSANGYEEI